MLEPTRPGRSPVDVAIALTAAAMLLSSALLGAGAHEHLTPYQPEIVCTVDHGDQGGPGRTAVHASERPHRHHCASCQLSGKTAAQRPAASALYERPAESPSPASASPPVVLAAHDIAASPRGPPIS
ncbi:MAG TPA: hypothetical protein VMT85_17880 [Thermoanaerobaculia bacterium]|nr:hypothetical protein [Thermoanaerobaculia bacterium]